MTLVDTSVWIDFLEGGDHWTKERLKRLIEDRESIVYTHMILLEIIQGLREKKDRKKIETKFRDLVLAPQKRTTIMLAADIYQGLQRKGIRIRSIIDCLIAASAIEIGANVLHKDRDFEYIAKHYPLKLETL
jgi:predicted nucleic acid-binding protein